MIDHYYYKIHGWFVQENLFTQMVLSCNDIDEYHFVEIGSWKGKSSSYMGVEIINSGKRIKFDCVDTWEGSEEHTSENGSEYDSKLKEKDYLYGVFLKNIEPVKSVINPIRMKSIEASKLYDDESLDFVFIDAAHDYQSVKEDIEHWFPKIKYGGWISGDDYDWEGVNRAVEYHFGNKVTIIKSSHNNLNTSVDKTWIIQKK